MQPIGIVFYLNLACLYYLSKTCSFSAEDWLLGMVMYIHMKLKSYTCSFSAEDWAVRKDYVYSYET